MLRTVLFPLSGVFSLHSQQWYMSYRFVDSCRAGAYAPARQLSTNLYDYTSVSQTVVRGPQVVLG